MKKTLFVLTILLIFICLASCINLSSDKKISEGLEFRLDDDGNAYYLSGIGTCTDEEVIIPDTYNGLPVTAIGYRAFDHCDFITKIVIPNSVTYIVSEAFYKCESLQIVEISKSVEQINSSTFIDCSSLIDIKVDKHNEYYKSIDGNLYTKDGKELLQYAVAKTDALFVIPDSVTTIHSSAFEGCESLTNIEIPNSVKTIGRSAFKSCFALTNIAIPDSVTYIYSDTFLGCCSLTNVEISKSVTSIHEWAFDLCDSLISIEVDENNEYYKSIDGNLYTKDGKTLVLYARGKQDASFVIPDSVINIGMGAFEDCKSIISIEIPGSVVSIGSRAFESCYSLANIIIPNSVVNIGYCAFRACFALANVEFEKNSKLQRIDGDAFAWCDSLTSIVIPRSVTSVGTGVFDGCGALTIYCEAESKPDGWNNKWNFDGCPVIWGYNAEE